ncbi:MAG: hypothetical protein RhofKO_19640 [Rhodothermales bacterium]
MKTNNNKLQVKRLIDRVSSADALQIRQAQRAGDTTESLMELLADMAGIGPMVRPRAMGTCQSYAQAKDCLQTNCSMPL